MELTAQRLTNRAAPRDGLTCSLEEAPRRREGWNRLDDSPGTVAVSSHVARRHLDQGDTSRSTVELGDDHRVQTVPRGRTEHGTADTPPIMATLIKSD